MQKKMKKPFRLSLLPRILIAIGLGIVCSLFFPVWAVRIFVTVNSIFSNFLGMFIPLLIIGLVAPGIADLGRGAGRLLLITALIAYVSTVLSGLFSWATCSVVYPSLIGSAAPALAGIDMSGGLAPYFTVEMPSFINVTTALVLAFIIGLGIVATSGTALERGMEDFRGIVTTVIT